MRKIWPLILGIVLLLIGLAGIAALEIVEGPGSVGRIPAIGPGPGQIGGRGFGMMRRFRQETTGTPLFGRVSRPATFTLNGERIYFTGIDEQGAAAIPSLPMAGMMGLTCADCHGADRKGGILMPDGVTRSSEVSSEGLKAISGAQVEREITQGVDEKGGALSPWMPRWSMPELDLTDLVDYLKGTP